MKPVLSVLLIFLLVIVAVHHSSALNKRYYDTWDSTNDVSSNANDESIRIFSLRQKGYKRQDLCANTPLWYLKHQARLGKLPLFYDCFSLHHYK